MSHTAHLGMGSNLGDRRALLDQAVQALRAIPDTRVELVSDYTETPAAGGPPGQGPFLNAAVTLRTDLDAHALHAKLVRIEQEAGRVRLVRWGERTLDLDLLLYDEAVIETKSLRVPHPRMALRRFVVAPLAEIAPNVVHPVLGRCVAELLENLDRRPSVLRLVASASHPWLSALRTSLEDQLGVIWISEADPAVSMERPDRWLILRSEPDAPSSNWSVPEPTFQVRLPDVNSASPGPAQPWLPEPGVPSLSLEHDDLDGVTEEIVATCHAARG